jgi:hypothetical protein
VLVFAEHHTLSRSNHLKVITFVLYIKNFHFSSGIKRKLEVFLLWEHQRKEEMEKAPYLNEK